MNTLAAQIIADVDARDRRAQRLLDLFLQAYENATKRREAARPMKERMNLRAFGLWRDGLLRFM